VFYKKEEVKKAIEKLKQGKLIIFVIKNTGKRVWLLAVQNNEDVSELVAIATRSPYKRFAKLKNLSFLGALSKEGVDFEVKFKL
jgi:hypothetical protein